MSVEKYIRENLLEVDFFMFARHLKYTREDEALAKAQFISVLDKLSKHTDTEISRLAKKKKSLALVRLYSFTILP
jgi:hypothetical protein